MTAPEPSTSADLERLTPASVGEPHKIQKTGGWELAAAAGGCVVGAGIALYAAGQTWSVDYTERPVPLGPIGIFHSGGELAPLMPALGWVSLAGAGALLATRGWGRRAVGVLLAFSGLAISTAVSVVWSSVDDDEQLWPVLGALAGAVVAAMGVWTFIRGTGWPSMGTRYESGPQKAEGGLWEAIERGEDPTG